MPHEGNVNMRILGKERTGGSDPYLAMCCTSSRVGCGDSCAFATAFAGDSAERLGNTRQLSAVEKHPGASRPYRLAEGKNVGHEIKPTFFPDYLIDISEHSDILE